MNFVRVQKNLQMGLGEAIQRLMRVEVLLQQGLTRVPESSKNERQLILDALNTLKLDLGFDCNNDNLPDSVDIFTKSAETSCCRIMPADTSRSAPSASPRRGAERASSRRKTGESD
jgi:hypothetical protein